jgi:hypothetical protein
MEKRLRLVAAEEAALDAYQHASKVVAAGGHAHVSTGTNQNLIASCFR